MFGQFSDRCEWLHASQEQDLRSEDVADASHDPLIE
jgi:hypothetical protein